MSNAEQAYRRAITTPLIDAHKHLVLLGLIFIAISAATWAVDIMGLVYACPYCRAQRTAIGILGLIILLLPLLHPFIARYLALAVGGFGFVVGATQHFAGWRRIHAGEFQLHEQWWIDPFLLSGCALLILALQLGIIFEYNGRPRA